MVLPYEKQLIPHYEEIKLEFKEALEDHNIDETDIGEVISAIRAHKAHIVFE